MISGLWRNTPARPRDQAAVHPVDRRRHRPVPARRAGAARHSPGERPGRQRPRGRRARDGADPRAGRRLPEARDNQARRHWRGMIGDLAAARGRARRQDAAHRRSGQIGGRLAQLAKAFDMRVIGMRRNPAAGQGAADAVHAMGELTTLLPRSRFRRADLPADEGDRKPDRCRCARAG